MLGIAEMVLAFGKLRKESSRHQHIKGETLAAIADLVPRIERARLYRGRGGEIMRSAACRAVECLSLAEIPLSVAQQVRFVLFCIFCCFCVWFCACTLYCECGHFSKETVFAKEMPPSGRGSDAVVREKNKLVLGVFGPDVQHPLANKKVHNLDVGCLSFGW